MIETIRDWVVIYAGLLWMLFVIIAAALLGGLWIGSSLGLNAVDRAVTDKVRPRLALLHARVAALRDQTSRLPGNTPLPDAVAVPDKRKLPRLTLPGRRRSRFSLPFRRKRRRLPLLKRG